MKRPAAPSRACPICGKPTVEAFKPFCSARCKDIDLHRWLKGSYGIPGRAAEDEDEEGGQSPSGAEKDRE